MMCKPKMTEAQLRSLRRGAAGSRPVHAQKSKTLLRRFGAGGGAFLASGTCCGFQPRKVTILNIFLLIPFPTA
ncbi:MAG: hypothetical protein PHI96_02255 [Desulfovibrio sp.]|nr:hypothetical protein [Desulfovibrio sp.]